MLEGPWRHAPTLFCPFYLACLFLKEILQAVLAFTSTKTKILAASSATFKFRLFDILLPCGHAVRFFSPCLRAPHVKIII
jgi:hypothetical protein